MRLRTSIALLVVVLCVAVSARAQKLRDGTAVLGAMHDRYANNWYETLTFKQESITHKPDGMNSSEIWYEALLLPGKLRIATLASRTPRTACSSPKTN